jgi:hypothetical protein
VASYALAEFMAPRQREELTEGIFSTRGGAESGLFSEQKRDADLL